MAIWILLVAGCLILLILNWMRLERIEKSGRKTHNGILSPNEADWVVCSVSTQEDKAVPILSDEEARKKHDAAIFAKAELEALKVRDQKMEEYAKAHEEDVASFSFECVAFGDFLTFVAKRGYLRHCGSLNLSLIKEIQFIEGHVPGDDGTLSYSKEWRPGKDSGSISVSWSGSGRFDEAYEKAGYISELQPRYVKAYAGNFLFLSGKQRKGYDDCECEYYNFIERKTSPYPRPAESDRIIFVDTKQELHCPAGLGEDVYRTIVATAGRRKCK